MLYLEPAARLNRNSRAFLAVWQTYAGLKHNRTELFFSFHNHKSYQPRDDKTISIADAGYNITISIYSSDEIIKHGSQNTRNKILFALSALISVSF